MESKFIDTNIFLEVFARKGQKSKNSKKLLQSRGDLFTTNLVFSEIEWTMRSVYKAKKEVIVKSLKTVLASKIEIENKKLLTATLIYYEKNNVDWTDCLNMFLVKNINMKEVYSYDKGFDKYDWIRRVEP